MISKRGFSVAHQRVAVDVDILNESLNGRTELTVVPTTLDLKTIVLDARRLTIEKCFVNGIESVFEHKDLLCNPPECPSTWSVEQYRLYKSKLDSVVNQSGDAPGELHIHLPDSVHISEPNDATFIASHSTKEKTYEPLTVRIFYKNNPNPRSSSFHNEGLHFVTSNPVESHVYTTHSPIGQATSCWLPCLDGLWSLSTWELEFHIPQLLDESNSESELVVACNNVMPNEEPDPSNEQGKIVKFDIFTPVSSQHIGFAIGPFKAIPITLQQEAPRSSGPLTDESNNMFGMMNPGMNMGMMPMPPPMGMPMPPPMGMPMPPPMGMADMGPMPPMPQMPMPQMPMPNMPMNMPPFPMSMQFPMPQAPPPPSSGAPVRDNRQIVAYVLPSKAKLVRHTCSIFPRAMKYFLDSFGTPPFDSYSLCFVSDFGGQTKYTGDAYALTVCSDSLLYDSNLIEPRFEYCETLIRGLAAQWCGVAIVPASWNDLWITEGIALFMTNLFIRKLMGNNEFRYRMRRGNDKLCQEDVSMPPIGAPRFRFPLSCEDLAFIRLKAPLVLFILDRRLAKTDRSFGVSRVLTKLFMQSMSGDLRSQLSTSHFMRQCEKVAHYRLTRFFDEWVYGSGYPIFRITQRFNKKRTCIEMGIGQVHSRELPPETLRSSTFLFKAITELNETERIEEEKILENMKLMRELAGSQDPDMSLFSSSALVTSEPAKPTTKFLPVANFNGPMTIRIHEANGTPYEHVVDLREQFTKIDIPYNTKYKRLRRNQKFRKSTVFKDGTIPPIERTGSILPNFSMESEKLINCLGDVLMSDYEVNSWNFVDWGDGVEEEEVMFNEAFEWLRADADFEWLGQFFVSQPDYMYASQLQQDRDVVAQYDAVRYFGRQQANPIYGTVLTRTVMDQRYFYGVRVAAVEELARLAVPQVQYLGMTHLLRIFRELYCLGDSKLPKANNFQNFPSYFVQKAIPKALSQIRDQASGMCPIAICNFILDLIRYNENSENPFSDSYYMACLLESAANSVRPVDLETGRLVCRGAVVRDISENPQYHKFLSDVVAEIDKCQRLDRWVPSPYHLVTTTAIKIEELLILAGYGHPRMDKLLLATKPDEAVEVRLAAISSLLNLGAYKSEAVMKYLYEIFTSDPSFVIHTKILHSFAKLFGHIAINGELQEPSTSTLNSRQVVLARKHVATAVPLLRQTFKSIAPLKKFIWDAVLSPHTGAYDRRFLLEFCELLYEPKASLIVKMKAPPLFELSMKRRKDWHFVVKYRSVLKKPKTDKEAPKLKLKLGMH